MRNRLHVLALVAGLAWSLSASATTIFVHSGALNPVTDEGWTGFASANASTTASPVINDIGSGYDAWAVDDNSTALDTLRYYYEDLTVAQVNEGFTDGWRLSTRLRVVNINDAFNFTAGYGNGSSVSAIYRDFTRDWALYFGSQADGDTRIRLPNGVIYEFEGSGTGYHLYELVYDPSAASADFFIDGIETVSNIVGNTTAFSQRRVLWGAATSTDAGEGRYNYVRFATSSAVVPLPGAVWLLGGALVLLGRLRRAA